MASPTRPYVVRSGDYLSAIASAHGVDPADIWEHESNEQLRQIRPNPEMLKLGDVLFIPIATRRWHSVGLGQVNKFIGRPVMMDVHLNLADGTQPIANAAFTVDIAGAIVQGTTDGQGHLSLSVPVKQRTLLLTLSDSGRTFEIRVGGLDPMEETSGVQMRLAHLGFYGGPIDGRLSDHMQSSISAFQRSQNLDVTGEMDSATLARLRDVHGS